MNYTEKTLRRKANNIGFIIRKGYVRTMAKPSVAVDTVSGYTIYNSEGTYMIHGYNELYYNLLTLEDVEQILLEEYEARKLAF